MLEIYTTGGGESLTRTLNAVAALTTTDDYEFVLGLIAAFSCMIIAVQIAFGSSLYKIFLMLVGVAMLSGASIGIRTDVIIYDKTKGSLWSSTVDNVPFSVAGVGYVTSTISHKVTQQMETFFAPPNNLSYSKTGMMFGSTLMAKSARWRAVTSSVHENLVNYFDQCVIDAISLRYITPESVLRSGELEAQISSNLPNSLAYYDVTTNTTRLCKEGWSDLISATTDDVENVLAYQAAAIYQLPPDVLGVNGPQAVSDLKNALSDFASFSEVAAPSAVAQIKQSMLIAALDDAAVRGIAASTNAAALEHLQSARAEVQTRSSYQAVGANAAAWVPYMKIVFENIYYGAFPFAFLLMFIPPMTFRVAKGYFGGFLWLASWEPLSAILHSFVMERAASSYRAVGSLSSDGALNEAVISWANHYGVYSVQQDVAALAGFMMMSVPFLATAIFYGFNQMTSLATSLTNVSQGAAIDAGKDASTGNYSYGNSSVGNHSALNWSRDNYTRNNRTYDNESANRVVTAPYIDVLGSTRRAPGGELITENADGTVGIDAGYSAVRTNVQFGLGESIVGTTRRTASAMQERGHDYRRAATRAVSDLASQTTGFIEAVNKDQIYTDASGSNTNREARTNAVDAISTINQFARSNGISRQTAIDLTSLAAVEGGWGVDGLGLIPFAKVSGSVRRSMSNAGIDATKFDDLKQSAQSLNVDKAFSTLQSSYHSLSETDQSRISKGQDYSSRITVDDVRRLEDSAAYYERGSQAWTEASDRAQSSLVDSRVNLTPAFVAFALDEGYSLDQVRSMTNGLEGGAALRAQVSDAFIANYIGDIVQPQISDKLGADLPPPNLDSDLEAYVLDQNGPEVGSYSLDSSGHTTLGHKVNAGISGTNADLSAAELDAPTENALQNTYAEQEEAKKVIEEVSRASQMARVTKGAFEYQNNALVWSAGNIDPAYDGIYVTSIGGGYSSEQIVPHSRYRDPIQHGGPMRGRSRKWGDAMPQVQTAAISAIRQAASNAGMTPEQEVMALAIAQYESGFNPDAAAGPSSAHGLGQFINSTGSKYGLNDNNRWDLNAQAEALVAHTMDNFERVEAAGLGPEYVYALHHDGALDNRNGGVDKGFYGVLERAQTIEASLYGTSNYSDYASSEMRNSSTRRRSR